MLNDIDADSDGKISRDEYIAARDREFARYDQNGDGNLSMADFARSASYRRALGRIDERVAQADKEERRAVARGDPQRADGDLRPRQYLEGRYPSARTRSRPRARLSRRGCNLAEVVLGGP